MSSIQTTPCIMLYSQIVHKINVIFYPKREKKITVYSPISIIFYKNIITVTLPSLKTHICLSLSESAKARHSGYSADSHERTRKRKKKM